MIICPNCGNTTTVTKQSRDRPNASYVWRSRTCKQCHKTFSTREYSLEELTKLIDEGKESIDNMRGQCDDLLEDLAQLLSQYKNG